MSPVLETLGLSSVKHADRLLEPNDHEGKHLLWPALLVLTRGRMPQSATARLSEITSGIRSLSFMQRRGIPPGRLRSPAAVDDVLAWLADVWRRISQAGRVELIEERRVLTNEILESGLSSEEQAGLLTALDYLCRLLSARLLAVMPDEPGNLRLPATKSEVMQSTYRKLVGLSATDLPIWLAGEAGTELKWMARLVHRLRDLPEDDFLIRHLDGSRLASYDGSVDGRETTYFVQDLDKKGEHLQRVVHEELLGGVRQVGPNRLIVTSGPPHECLSSDRDMYTQLWAFLAPTMVEIPPLRKRVEDIPALMDFLSPTHPGNRPSARLSREASELLGQHHWPGNVDELRIVTQYVLERRPTGTVIAEHLPDTFRAANEGEPALMQVLETIQRNQGFRVLKSEAGRLKLARFLLLYAGEETFTASDLQKVLSLGRETVRRLLRTLEEHYLVKGLKGAGGKRITRYRSVDGTKP